MNTENTDLYKVYCDEVKILEKCVYSSSYIFKFMGLMGEGEMAEDTGILLKPCNGIHTFFMRFDIDIIMFNKERKITKIIHELKPWRLGIGTFKTYGTIELKGGSLKRFGERVRIGREIKFKKIDREFNLNLKKNLHPGILQNCQSLLLQEKQ